MNTLVILKICFCFIFLTYKNLENIDKLLELLVYERRKISDKAKSKHQVHFIIITSIYQMSQKEVCTFLNCIE